MARPSWIVCVIATNKLTEKRDQFLGIMTSEYRDQMHPVKNKAMHWAIESVDAARVKSFRPAKTRPCWNNEEKFYVEVTM